MQFQKASLLAAVFSLPPLRPNAVVWGLSAHARTSHSTAKGMWAHKKAAKNPTGRGAFEVSASLLGQLHPNINSGGVSGLPARTHGSPSVLSVEL